MSCGIQEGAAIAFQSQPAALVEGECAEDETAFHYPESVFQAKVDEMGFLGGMRLLALWPKGAVRRKNTLASHF